MKARELRELSLPELKEKLSQLREEFFNLRFQRAMHRLENPMKIRNIKRDIARCLTVIREKELKIGER
ncbi:MAG: 50S ribosomal protein L29 [Caldimicrobium sp.]|nr:50S ribosomal protein L29 [Caldimicrobium sp.]MCX7873130.1 50S ribosomal protein L29 [Caldimicrobium sp.]MDW8094884.1 50S ribosomal protein L29 [Caldimicrobium sp.]